MESRGERRLRCWESVMPAGVIEAPCPVCHCSVIRYSSTSGNTFQQMHIVPASKSGSDQSWNLLPGCGCNQNMRHMNLVDWMGTRGNKRQLLKELFLRKYKSLVAPCYRAPHDREQLVKWVYQTYQPAQLEEYRDWMLLLDADLLAIQLDAPPTGAVKHDESVESMAPTPTTAPTVSSSNESCDTISVLDNKSPHFAHTYRYNVKQRLAHTNIHMAYPHVHIAK